MPVRIDGILVKADGPLSRDFHLEATDLNLVYGRNETGKTYIVEAVCDFLFRRPVVTGRDWKPKGHVMLSGLEEGQTRLTRTGKSLGEDWEEVTGLPPDLSRLLVVRAGETELSATSADGVGDVTLKSVLSGEKTLDQVEGRVSGRMHSAYVEDGIIQVHAGAAEEKARLQLEEEMATIDGLLERVDASDARTRLRERRRAKVELENELGLVRRAKRHAAYRLDSELRERKKERSLLPDRDEQTRISGEMKNLFGLWADRNNTKWRIEELERDTSLRRWAEGALETYEQHTLGMAAQGAKSFLLWIGIALLAGSAVCGVIGIPAAVIAGAAASVAFLVMYAASAAKAARDAGRTEELERLDSEYREKFDEPLTSSADLRSRIETLRGAEAIAEDRRGQLREIEASIEASEKAIAAFFDLYSQESGDSDEWNERLREMRAELDDADDTIASMQSELDRLNVPSEAYIEQSPGVEWDPDREQRLTAELEDVEEEIERLGDDLSELKAEIKGLTGRKMTDSMEDLVTALRDLRDAKESRHRQVMASMTAQVAVMNVIRDLRAEEGELIDRGLEEPVLSEAIRKVTSHYTGICMDEERRLVLATREGELYPLAALSTGAREQVYLALRTAFASMVMKDNAFLLLDDAFQHSDWNRRTRMVNYTLGLVNSGWQVFYFCVDYHLRNLFMKAGEGLGGRFRSMELG